MVVAEHMKIHRPPGARFPIPAAATECCPRTELILSAIETGQYSKRERRGAARAEYRVQALLRLFSDLPDTPPWKLFTRDVNPRGLGFITENRLPLGYGGLLDIILPDGDMRTIACTLLRCREAAPGWYEGSMYFNRRQNDFALVPSPTPQESQGK